VFQLAAANPAYVAAGNILPQVTIPAGQLNSNTFTIYGATILNAYLLPDTLDPVISIPAGAWGITNTTGSTQLLDANNPNMSCRDSGTPNISTTPSVLSSCGVPVNGVASDGVNPLLIREAGLGGTACYQVTSTAPPDQGTIQTASATTTQVGSTYYGFSLYTPPAAYMVVLLVTASSWTRVGWGEILLVIGEGSLALAGVAGAAGRGANLAVLAFLSYLAFFFHIF
jgi:hypothetical protein